MISVSLQSVRAALRGLRHLKPSKNVEPARRCVRIRGVEDLATIGAVIGREHLCFEALGVSDAPGDILVPFDQLSEVVRTADADTPVTFVPGSHPSMTTVVAGTPVTVAVEPVDALDFPIAPVAAGRHIELPARVVRAVRDALDTASTDPSREVLNGVQLEAGAVVGTDGRQLHALRGLELAIPPPGVLLPRSKVIGLLNTKELADLFLCRDAAGEVTHVKLYQGPWSWTVELGELRFPNWRQVVPRVDAYPVHIDFSDEDEMRMRATLPRLPGCELRDSPVLLVAGESGVTLQSPPGTPRVMLRLASSRAKGPEVRVAFNRQFLLRALAFGFRLLHVRDAVSPLCMADGDRIQVWMPVRLDDPEPEARVEPSREAAAVGV